MKILIVGDWHSEVHEEVVLQALQKLNYEVTGFSWHHYFDQITGEAFLFSIWKRFQNKYLIGPLVNLIQRDLLNTVQQLHPDVIFFYRPTHIKARVLNKIKKLLPRCKLVGYNNDDPFAPSQPKYLWRHFIKALPKYDLSLVYRLANFQDYFLRGAKNVKLLRSWFVPEKNYPVILSEVQREKYECDVVFVGHFENDQRLSCLEGVVRENIKLRIFGPGRYWNPVIKKSQILSDFAPVQYMYNEEYNCAISGAKIALCFLSKLNRDTYTRRCFEIPAIGTMLLSEFSEDLAALYQEGKEIEFFRDKNEMIDKIKFYLANPEKRKKIAMAGQQRVVADGHDVVSRMQNLAEWIKEL